MTGHARDELIPKNNHAANTVIMVCHVTRFLLYQKFRSPAYRLPIARVRAVSNA